MDSLVRRVADRMGTDSNTDLRPAVIAMTILQACHLGLHMWMMNPDTDFPVLAGRAFDLVEPGLEAVLNAPPTGI